MASRDVHRKSSSRCKVPPLQSWKAGNVHCCNLEAESYTKEESRLQGFCDIDLVEASSNTSVGEEASPALDILDHQSCFSTSFTALSLAFWPSLLALALALSLSLVLWLRILFFSFSGSKEMSTSTSSSCTSPS